MKKSKFSLILIAAFYVVVSVNSSYAQGTDPYAICALNIGTKVPVVEVTNLEGEKQSLAEVCSKPTVLVFYRGGWCPYCNKQLSSLQEAQLDIKEAGYELIAISADKHESMDKSIDKRDLTYQLYSDNSMDAARAFGIAFRMTDKQRNSVSKKVLAFDKWAGEEQMYLPVPSVFIIKDGEIAYRYVNPDFKTRLTSEMLIAALKSLED